MSPDTLRFLLWLVCAQQLTVGAEDFDALAQQCSQAKAELQAALDDT